MVVDEARLQPAPIRSFSVVTHSLPFRFQLHRYTTHKPYQRPLIWKHPYHSSVFSTCKTTFPTCSSSSSSACDAPAVCNMPIPRPPSSHPLLPSHIPFSYNRPFILTSLVFASYLSGALTTASSLSWAFPLLVRKHCALSRRCCTSLSDSIASTQPSAP